MKMKKGDKVIVIAGKHKGARGSITKVLAAANRVVVEGVAKVKHHQKPRKQNESGSVVEREASVHASNVMLIDGKTDKQTRVGSKRVGEKKVRIARKSEQEI